MRNFSLAVWYLSPTNHHGGWASERSTARLPLTNSLCLYCMSPENHILRRGTQSMAMSPWTGKLVTQSELFTDDCVAPLKILQLLLSFKAKLWRLERHFTEEQQNKTHRRTEGHWSWDVMGEMSVLDVRAKVWCHTSVSHSALGSLESSVH